MNKCFINKDNYSLYRIAKTAERIIKYIKRGFNITNFDTFFNNIVKYYCSNTQDLTNMDTHTDIGDAYETSEVQEVIQETQEVVQETQEVVQDAQEVVQETQEVVQETQNKTNSTCTIV